MNQNPNTAVPSQKLEISRTYQKYVVFSFFFFFFFLTYLSLTQRLHIQSYNLSNVLGYILRSFSLKYHCFAVLSFTLLIQYFC